MIHILTSIRDNRSKIFSHPQVAPNVDVAIRNCKILTSNKDSLIGVYPEDFDLCVLGTFDDEKGTIDFKFEVVGCLGGFTNAVSNSVQQSSKN